MKRKKKYQEKPKQKRKYEKKKYANNPNKQESMKKKPHLPSVSLVLS